MGAATIANGAARGTGGMFSGVHRITFVEVILWAVKSSS